MDAIFSNILILMNPQVGENQERFEEADKKLSEFIKENSRQHYAEFFALISSDQTHQNALQALVTSNQINQSQVQQIKFWFITQLIKVVKSEQFSKQWTDQERDQFKQTFLQWLFTNFSSVLGQNFFLKKLSLLFVAVFERMSLVGSNGQDLFSEYIRMFFDMQYYPELSQLIQQQQQLPQQINPSPQVTQEIQKFTLFVKFIQACILDVHKQTFDWDKLNYGDTSLSQSQEDDFDKHDKDKIKPKEEDNQLQISDVMRLQDIFNQKNVTGILVFLQELVQFKQKGVIEETIYQAVWKILKQFLNFRSYGKSTDEDNDTPQENIQRFTFFIQTATIEIQQISEQSPNSMVLLKNCLKFLTSFINSDILLDQFDDSNDMGPQKSKNKLLFVTKKMNDLSRKLANVEIVSQCIHNDKGIIYSSLMGVTDPVLENHREKMISALSCYLSDSIQYFTKECSQISKNVRDLQQNYLGIQDNQDSGFDFDQMEEMLYDVFFSIQEDYETQEDLSRCALKVMECAKRLERNTQINYSVTDYIDGAMPASTKIANQKTKLFGINFKNIFDTVLKQSVGNQIGYDRNQVLQFNDIPPNLPTAERRRMIVQKIMDQIRKELIGDQMHNNPDLTQEKQIEMKMFQQQLDQKMDEINRINSCIFAQLNQIMQLTFFLLKQPDPKICINACHIVHDYVQNLIQKQPESAEIKEIFSKFIEMVFIKFGLPCEDQDNILDVYFQRIRLGIFSTSLQNSHEETFQRLREILSNTLQTFLSIDSFASEYAKILLGEIDRVKQALSANSTSSPSKQIRQLELIYQLLNCLFKFSKPFNEQYRKHHVANADGQTVLQEFMAQEQIQWLFFDDKVREMVNYDQALNPGTDINIPALFYSLHSTLKELLYQFVEYSCQDNSYNVAYRQQSDNVMNQNLIKATNDQTFSVMTYLLQQLNNKVSLPVMSGGGRDGGYERSHEEVDLLKEQIKYIEDIIVSNRLQLPQISITTKQFATIFQGYLHKLNNFYVNKNVAIGFQKSQSEMSYLMDQGLVVKLLLKSIMSLMLGQASTANNLNEAKATTQQAKEILNIMDSALQTSQQNHNFSLKSLHQKLLINCFQQFMSCVKQECSNTYQYQYSLLKQQQNLGQQDQQQYSQYYATQLSLMNLQMSLFLLICEGCHHLTQKILQDIHQRKIVADLTSSVISIVQNMWKNLSTIQYSFKSFGNQEEADRLKQYQKDKNDFAISLCQEIVGFLVQQSNTPDDELIFKHELLNGILKLFVNPAIEDFASDSLIQQKQNEIYYDEQLLLSQIQLMLQRVDINGENLNFGQICIKYLIQQQYQQNSRSKLVKNQYETDYLLFNILKDLSLLGSGFYGIQNEEQLYCLVRYLVHMIINHHHSKNNRIRILALNVIRNTVHEMQLDNDLNASQNYTPNPTFVNNDLTIMHYKRECLDRLNKYLLSTYGGNIVSFIREKNMYFAILQNSFRIIREIDYLNMRLMWKIARVKSQSHTLNQNEFIESQELQVMVQLQGRIIIEICNVLPNHITNKDNFLAVTQQIFQINRKPSQQQVHSFVDIPYDNDTDNDATRQMLLMMSKPDIFTIDFLKRDDSYPKRLSRLTKNLALRNNKQYWSNCFELRDALTEFLSQTDSQICIEDCLQRMVKNVQDYYRCKTGYNTIIQIDPVNSHIQLQDDDLVIDQFLASFNNNNL